MTTDEDVHVVRGSAWVMAGYVAQAVTGALFWLVAARVANDEVVGRATALFASLQFVNYLTAMGLQEMLGRHHDSPDDERDNLVWWSILVTVATSAIGTVAYLALVPSSGDVLVEHGWISAVLLFGALSAGSAVALLVDVLWIARRRWKLVFLRLFLVGGMRLPLVALPFADDAVWLFVVMAGPAALSGVIGVARLHAVVGVRPSFTPRRPDVAALRCAAANYAGHLARWAPQFALPVIVLVHVDPEENANFFLAWTIAAVLVILPVMVGRVLLVEGSRRTADVVGSARSATVVAGGVAAACWLAALLLQPVVVAVYGDDYRQAADLLPTLLAGGVPWAVTSIALARAQVVGDHVALVTTTAVLGFVTIGLAAALVPDSGLTGAGRAWLVGNIVAAAVAAATTTRVRRSERLDATVAAAVAGEAVR